MAFIDTYTAADLNEIQQGEAVGVKITDTRGMNLSKHERERGIEGKVQSCSAKKQQIRINVSKHGNTTQHVIDFANIESISVRGRRIGGSSEIGNAGMIGTAINQQLAAARR